MQGYSLPSQPLGRTSAEVPSLRLVATGRQPVGLAWGIGLVVASLLLAVGAWGRTWVLQREARSLQQQVSLWEQKGVQEEARRLRERLAVYRSLQNEVEKVPEALEVLRQLSLRLPRSVWMDRVQYDRPSQSVLLEGWALSKVAAEDALARLRIATRLCRSVHLQENEDTPFQGQPAYRFRILLELVQR